MDKNKILELARNLYEQALETNACYSIIKQYHENSINYNREMNSSPAFYCLLYLSLQKNILMNIAKLYEHGKDSITIGYLLKECKTNYEIFPEKKSEFQDCGNIIDIPYVHIVKPDEECYFKSDERKKKQMELYKEVGIPVEIELTIQEYIEFYQKKYCGIRPIIENVRTQRNKIYAHNDKISAFNIDEVLAKNPVSYGDIDKLIQFALDVTIFIIESLSDIVEPRNYLNIDDWESTLQLVKIGIKYDEADRCERRKRIEEELNDKYKMIC